MSSAEESWTKLLLVSNQFGILTIWDLIIWDLGFGQCLQRSRVRPSRCRFLINDFALKSNGGWNMMDGSIDKVQLVVDMWHSAQYSKTCSGYLAHWTNCTWTVLLAPQGALVVVTV